MGFREYILRVLAFLLALAPITLGVTYKTRFEDVEWDDDNWHIISRDLNPGRYQSRMSLSNGYLGINLACLGPFFEIDRPYMGDSINGWPVFDQRNAFASISGFYSWQATTNGTNYNWLLEQGGETIISGVPHWAGLPVKAANGAILNAYTPNSDIQDFSSTLDLGAGVLKWGYSWKPNGKEPIEVEYSMFVHKLHLNQAAVQIKLTATRDTNVTVYDVLEGDAAKRTEFVDKAFETNSRTIWSAVRPQNVTNVTAYIYSTLTSGNEINFDTRKLVTPEEGLQGIFGKNESSIAQSVEINLKAGQTVQLEKIIGAASSDAFSDPQTIASRASLSGAAEGYVKLLSSHIAEWKTILTPDSVDRYTLPNGTLPNDQNILELQINAVTNPFYILQHTVGPNAIAAADNNSRLGIDSIPVCGFGADCYGGLVFWDAEVWMAPGLQVSHPYSMQQIVRYRVEKFAQAKENIKRAYTSSQNQTGKFSEGGAVYPWTSGRYGNCTATGPCFDYEYHINGDIGILNYNHFAVTGDGPYFKDHLLPIHNAVAYFFGELMTYNETSGFYDLLNATDPDEYANNVNNIGFTTALIQKHLNGTNDLNSWFGLPTNDSWTEIAAKIRLPVHEETGIVLEYDTMEGNISVKQADVVLIDDLLHYENPYSRSDLDYYANKQSANGPGMTWGVFSIVANKVSEAGCSSYTYDLFGSQPYARGPWFQYSEQLIDNFEANGGTHPAFPFLTGMGGAHRVAVFGFLGLRLFVDRLDIDPSLPPQIPQISYRTIYWQGHGINATSNQTHTTLVRMPPDLYTLQNANTTFSTNPIPVTLGTRKSEGTFLLGFDEPLVVLNRQLGNKDVVPGNILQCAPDWYSEMPYIPGQFPLSAIDGASSTRWQPAYGNMTAYLTIDLGSEVYYPIKEIKLDWGPIPPTHFEILFSNYTSPPFTEENMKWVTNVTASNNITITEPFDPERAVVIETYLGNMTNVTLDNIVWTGRYVTLGISGNQNDPNLNETGATVAEWNLITTDLDKVAMKKIWERDGYEFGNKFGQGPELVRNEKQEDNQKIKGENVFENQVGMSA
jgi:trehalose/maltose hydrolase-like predicted phosphorylase